MVKYIALVPFVCLACFTGYAQDTAATDLVKSAENNAIRYYTQFIDKQSRLYNGIDHLGYSPKIKGHAYFEVNDLRNGSIVYDGMYFGNVPMMYDLLKDQVVILHFNNLMRMALINQKVKEFTIGDHHYIRLVKDSAGSQPLETGYYDEIYKGKTAVLARRSKFINETVTDHLEQEFIAKNSYYIKKDGNFKTVKSYKWLLGVFGDKARDVRRYLKKNRIKYRKDKETAIAKAAAYYDTLN